MITKTNINTPFATSVASAPAPAGKLARSFARVCLLEECIRACEQLAEDLGGEQSKLQIELSECISACAALNGATARESHYALPYGLICDSVCQNTVSACRKVEGPRARFVEVLCRAVVNMVSDDFGLAVAN
jgi:hypothetical protein